jgi:hypothetical protein
MTAQEHDPLVTLIEKEIDPMDEIDESELDGLDERFLRVLDALYHNAGIVASEDRASPTPEEDEDQAAIVEFLERLTDSH